MSKRIGAGVGILLLVLGYAVAGPFITLYHLRTAVAAHDQEALATYVDFPQLRENLKGQLDDRLAARVPLGTDNPFAAFGMMLASHVVNVMVDALVTPSGLGHLMAGEPAPEDESSGADEAPSQPAAPSATTAAGDGREPPAKPLLAHATYHFRDLSHFVARVTDQQGHAIDFVLTRDVLSWQLTNIILPAKG